MDGRKALYRFFLRGEKPTQGQFADLIDSCFNLVDDEFTVADVQGLGEVLNGKVSIEQFNALAAEISSISGLGLSTAGNQLTVAPGNWVIAGVQFSSFNPVVFTLAVQDATLSRYDLVYADNTGNIGVVTGIASVNPVPQAIPAGAIAVGLVLVTPASYTVGGTVGNFIVNNLSLGDDAVNVQIARFHISDTGRANAFQAVQLYAGSLTAANYIRVLQDGITLVIGGAQAAFIGVQSILPALKVNNAPVDPTDVVRLEDLSTVPGSPGPPGPPGTNGTNGTNGVDGESAYQIWLDAGNSGTQSDYLASLKGAKGDKGDPGAAGATGATGAAGANGTNGAPGATGAAGPPGPAGATGATGATGAPGTPGAAGANGTNGTNGVGVPAGGAAGYLLAKNSGADYDDVWIAPPAFSATFTDNDIRTTSTDGAVFINNTPATAAIPSQYSPRIRMHGSGYASSTVLTSQVEGTIELRPIIAPSATTGQFVFSGRIGTGAFVDFAYLDNLGKLTLNSIVANNNIQAVQNITAGYAIIATSATINNTKTTVNGSTSGSVIFGQPFNGSGYKKLVMYCNALNGTASYTFPQPFLFIPAIVNTNGLAASVVTSLAANSITITGTGAATTGFIILEGF